MRRDATQILRMLQATAAETRDRDELAATALRGLRDTLPQASWSGIYWLEGQELVLGPFHGPATDHTRIPVGRGVCGTAVEEGADQRVDDVRERANYLACSASVRSELVVLIRARDTIVGQFDFDAEEVGAFDADDLCVVRAVADAFGALIAALSDAPGG